jgi:hypothetical protein
MEGDMFFRDTPNKKILISKKGKHQKVKPLIQNTYTKIKMVIKFVSDLRPVGSSPGTPASSTNKTHGHDITKILLKVALNTITLIQ